LPKQVLKIDRFEKGILSAYNSKDIPLDGLVSGKACDIGTIGIVKLTPKAALDNESLNAGKTSEYLGSTYTLPPGHGFYIFPSDYTRPISNGVALNQETEFYVYSMGPKIFILDKGSLVWDGNTVAFDEDKQTIVLGTDSSSNAIIKPVFYYGAEALRVADGNYTNAGNDVGLKNKWFGHIKRSLFGETGDFTVNHDRWYVDNQELIPPTAQDASGADSGYSLTEFQGSAIAGLVDFDASAEAGTSGTTVAVPDNNEFLKIWAGSATDANGTWDIQAEYTFYISFIYDGSQESPVTKLVGLAGDSGSVTTHSSNQESLFVGVTLQYGTDNGSGHKTSVDANTLVNPRITGARLYYTDPSDGEGIKYLLLDIDLIKGCKKSDELSYTAWAQTTQGQTYICPASVTSADVTSANAFNFVDPPKALTYDILNGYGADEVTAAKYKCATILNNRCYIGNIQQEDNVGDGFASAPIYNDRIVRSPINFEGKPQFDTFPASQKMDIGVNDGDSIIALEGYADRLLVFKKKSIYIVNVAQDGQEGVENQLYNNGVNNPSQVIKFELGVAWCNPNGCFLYNGEQVKNLTEGKIYSGGKWEPAHNVSWTGGSFSQSWQIDSTHISALTYLYSKKQLWVSISMDADDQSNDAWVYDFKTEGWTMASGSMGTNTRNRSNIVIDSSGVPKFIEHDTSSSAEKLEVYSLQNIPSNNSEFKLITPDIDFGAPGVKKKIYKVYVSFKSDEAATNVKVNYSTNGSVEFAKTFQDGDNFTSNDLNTSANQDFSTNINEGEGVFNLAGTNQSALGNADIAVSNNIARITNDGTNQGYARYDLGTLAAKNYNLNLYFKPRFSAISRRENVKSSQAIISIGTSNSNPSTNRIVNQIIGQEGAYKISFQATAAAHYLYIQNQSSIDDDFIDVSNVSITEESDYYVAELKPTTSSEANNVYSFQLKFEADGQVPKGFEIGDISIIYRMKNVK